MTASQVENLPLNGRNWLDLVALVPGARGNPGTIRAGFGGGDMSKYQVDGIDVSGQCCGGSNQGYSQENIQEFEVITNRYDAEYGRAAGVVINAVTKSGTNQLRATGFGFLRDSDLGDAKNFITNRVEPFKEKQMGLNGGGPILRDRVFFFASYEYQAATSRQFRAPASASFDVPAENGVTRITRRSAATRSWTRTIACLRGHRHKTGSSSMSAWANATPSRTATAGPPTTGMSVGDTWVVTDRMVNGIRFGFS